MPHFRVGGQATAQALFQFVIRLRLSLVLTQMFAPRIHQEYFQVTIRRCGITEDPPSIRSVATADAGIFMDCLHELRFPLWNNCVFDRNQHRSPVKVGPNLFDNNWRAPVAKWTQIGGRVGKLRKEREYDSSNCSNPSINKGNVDARSLGDGTPGGASETEASLINQNKDRQHPRADPIRRQVLD